MSEGIEVNEYEMREQVVFKKHNCKGISCYLERMVMAISYSVFEIRMPLKYFARFKRSYVKGLPISFEVVSPDGVRMFWEDVSCFSLGVLCSDSEYPDDVFFEVTFHAG